MKCLKKSLRTLRGGPEGPTNPCFHLAVLRKMVPRYLAAELNTFTFLPVPGKGSTGSPFIKGHSVFIRKADVTKQISWDKAPRGVLP